MPLGAALGATALAATTAVTDGAIGAEEARRR